MVDPINSLVIEELAFAYPDGNQALYGVNLTVGRGERVALLGPNGAGKTTTLRMLSTILTPTSGTIEIAGIDAIKYPQEARAKLGFLTGSTGLYARLTPIEIIEYFAALYGVPQKEKEERKKYLFDLLNMNDFLQKRIGKLSTGMKQKVSICRTMIHDPEVVIFDEPTSGLDVITAENIIQLIRDCKEQGKTVIFSSHAIPGNESNVNKVIDGLLRAGAEVVHSGIADVHATGHAQAEDLKMYLSITEPEWFVPIHGEYHHMVANAKHARTMGVPDERVVLCEDGDVIEITDDGIELAGRVPSGYLYVDGIVGDVGQGVLRDRKVLAEEGVVVVVVTVDIDAGKVLVGPEIITRGWVYAPEAEDLIEEACETVARAVEKALKGGTRDIDALEKEVRRAAGKFVSERTKRRPMIVPIVMEI